ncbi:protein kinase UbiB [Austwickia sp. TVS 96-490-7B]|uniref:ABC1 kinase family protein n=1 Tax=Austwickia sp. TVS 96-490-7B TaxID=2830843 RepID=UPI001C577050|nr:AarF/ABC1/UbiB kinase family protein [Austwickia sp. TVS 96-490-7B]MBW3086616.1 protein kinase UbiB [Austwickia sp. TVS 96-490-7B]
MSDLPRRALSRSVRLAGLPVGMAGRAALGAGRRLAGQPAEQVLMEWQARTAEQLFTVLGELKGGAMKVGQALSVLEPALPADLVGPYRATLTRLQEAAPPMPTSTVHRLLARDLGADWRASFRDFDDRPAAAASIGQVHRATWSDGTPVAVKVQYPGAGEALLGDFRRLGRLARMTTWWVPGLDLVPLLAEFEARLADELDYGLEAQRQRRFAAAFEDDEAVCVPAVIAQQGQVLVSQWVDGRPLAQVVASGSAADRDHAADRYLEFLFAGPQLARLLHADPHPGNFRVLPDGRLGVLDFGAVGDLPGGMPLAMGQALRYAVEGDAQGVLTVLRDEGFVRPGATVDANLLLGFLTPFTDPLRADWFTFDRDWLGQQAARLRDPRQEDFGLGLQLNLPPEYLLIHRVWAGGLGVLCQIGGTVRAAEIAYSWLPSLDPLWEERVAADAAAGAGLGDDAEWGDDMRT